MKQVEVYTDGACSGNPGRAAGVPCCATVLTTKFTKKS